MSQRHCTLNINISCMRNITGCIDICKFIYVADPNSVEKCTQQLQELRTRSEHLPKVSEKLFLIVSCDFVRMKAKTLCVLFVCLGLFSHLSCRLWKFCHVPPTCHTQSHRISGPAIIFLFLPSNPFLSLGASFSNLGAEKGQAQSPLVQETPTKELPAAEKVQLSWCTLLSKLNKYFKALAAKGKSLILHPSVSQYGVKASQESSTCILSSILKGSPEQLLNIQFDVHVFRFFPWARSEHQP